MARSLLPGRRNEFAARLRRIIDPEARREHQPHTRHYAGLTTPPDSRASPLRRPIRTHPTEKLSGGKLDLLKTPVLHSTRGVSAAERLEYGGRGEVGGGAVRRLGPRTGRGTRPVCVGWEKGVCVHSLIGCVRAHMEL